MANAKRDGNFIPSLITASASDGKTIILIKADPVTHALYINNGTSGTDLGPKNAIKDDNGVSTLLAVSDGDGQSVVTAYGTSGELLVQST